MKQLPQQDNIKIVIEKSDGLLWGRVEGHGSFMPTPYGENTQQVVENLKELISDYIKHEGKKDGFWKNVDFNNLDIEFKYNLQTCFHGYNNE